MAVLWAWSIAGAAGRGIILIWFKDASVGERYKAFLALILTASTGRATRRIESVPHLPLQHA